MVNNPKQTVFNITNLVIIESLADKVKTGKQLHEKLEKKFHQIFQIEYFDISDKKSLYDLFETLVNKTNSDYHPVLHFEIHGHQSNLGLVLKSGEFISWFSLYYYCKDLNFNSGNNLFLTLATCRGAHIIGVTKPYDKCPWAFIMGSYKDLYNDSILTDFSTFYETLIDIKNIDHALAELTKINANAKYEIIDSMTTFENCKNYFVKEIEDEINTQKKGHMLLEAIERTSSFESAKLKLNIDYDAKIITKEDLIKYFSKNYLFATKSMVSDFRRFFCFWEK